MVTTAMGLRLLASLVCRGGPGGPPPWRPAAGLEALGAAKPRDQGGRRPRTRQAAPGKGARGRPREVVADGQSTPAGWPADRGAGPYTDAGPVAVLTDLS